MTTSSRKAEANRRNAQHSTGPKTKAGKAASAQNAIKHGMTAAVVCAPDEDPAAFDDVLAQLTEAFRPDGPLESALVERVAVCMVRMRRAARFEAGMLADASATERKNAERWSVLDGSKVTDAQIAGRTWRKAARMADLLMRYETSAERAMARALDRLAALQGNRALAAAYAEDPMADLLSGVSR